MHPSFNNPIEVHAKWAFEQIYSKPYQEKATTPANTLPRLHHGIEHVGSAAIYVPVFANLYRRFGYPDALSLTDEDIKLIQIAVLFHDSGRVNDDKDDTDRDSGLILYDYLINTGVSTAKAHQMAEAVANKDADDGYYWNLVNKGNVLTWEKGPGKAKSIAQILIHDTDCIDIIRARDMFEATYLDFCQRIAMKDNTIANQQAFDEMALLICEVRHLIDIRGDTRNNVIHKKKLTYQNDKAYQLLEANITLTDHPLTFQLYNKNALIPLHSLPKLSLGNTAVFDKTLGVTQDNLNAALNQGKLFSRGIVAPSGIRNKNKTSGLEENMVCLEMRKTKRRKGVKTQSRKADSSDKQGNIARSISMIGFGGGTYSNVGFIVMNPPLGAISSVFTYDADSGRGKKVKRNLAKDTQKDLDAVQNKLKKGGVFLQKYNSTHTEILCDLEEFDAIYFNEDDCTGTIGNRFEFYPYSSLLQAIFMQREYQNKYGVLLPIVKYSRFQHAVQLQKNYSDEELLSMWGEMCEAYLWDALKNGKTAALSLPNDEIKIRSMYTHDPLNARLREYFIKKLLPADSNYDKSLQTAINQRIDELKQQVKMKYQAYVRQKLIKEPPSLLTHEVYPYLTFDSHLISEFKETIQKQIALKKDPILLSLKFEGYNSLSRALRISEIGPPFYADVSVFRLYQLAKAIDDQKTISAIRQLLCEKYHNESIIKNNDPKQDELFRADKAAKAEKLHIINYFELAECRTDFNKRITNSLKRKNGTDTPGWWLSFFETIALLHEENQHELLQLLKPDINQLVVEFRKKMSEKKLSFQEGFNVKDLINQYILVAKYRNQAKTVTIGDLTTLFAHYHYLTLELYPDEELFKNLKESEVFTDDNILEYVVNHLNSECYEVDSYHNYRTFNALTFIKNFEKLVNCLPRPLTTKQCHVLIAGFVDKFQNKHIVDFFNLIDKEIKLPLPMNALLQKQVEKSCISYFKFLSQANFFAGGFRRCKPTDSIPILSKYDPMHIQKKEDKYYVYWRNDGKSNHEALIDPNEIEVEKLLDRRFDFQFDLQSTIVKKIAAKHRIFDFFWDHYPRCVALLDELIIINPDDPDMQKAFALKTQLELNFHKEGTLGPVLSSFPEQYQALFSEKPLVQFPIDEPSAPQESFFKRITNITNNIFAGLRTYFEPIAVWIHLGFAHIIKVWHQESSDDLSSPDEQKDDTPIQSTSSAKMASLGLTPITDVHVDDSIVKPVLINDCAIIDRFNSAKVPHDANYLNPRR